MSGFKITGIAAEYNPFHSGHAYQISRIKSDAVVAVMSGSFVQRGDVAVADKHTRAASAIKGGVDLAVELPVVFALNTAQKFALGAISLLDGMGVDEICFGSECGDLELLRGAALLLNREPCEVSEKIKGLMDGGMSYPAARETAYGDKIPSGLLSAPNNILALEYLRALDALGSKITPVTVKRVGAAHDSAAPEGSTASAAAIREMLSRGESAAEFTEFNGVPRELSRLDGAVLAKLRMMTPEELREINEVSEGLENRILRAATESSSIAELAEKVKTKRYTMSKIRRILISALLGLTSDMSAHMPDYIRVLALNERGRAALREIKKRTSLPIITKAADYSGGSPLFKADVRAADIAALCESADRRGGSDFTVSPIVL